MTYTVYYYSFDEYTPENMKINVLHTFNNRSDAYSFRDGYNNSNKNDMKKYHNVIIREDPIDYTKSGFDFAAQKDVCGFPLISQPYCLWGSESSDISYPNVFVVCDFYTLKDAKSYLESNTEPNIYYALEDYDGNIVIDKSPI